VDHQQLVDAEKGGGNEDERGRKGVTRENEDEPSAADTDPLDLSIVAAAAGRVDEGSTTRWMSAYTLFYKER
jgi:hypothetical protein